MKYIVYSLFIALSWLFCSCADDKGNYDYQDINKLVFSGIDSEQWYKRISHVDTLKLYPEIENIGGKKELGDYRYEWKFIPSRADESKGDDTVNFVVATTKHLELPITQKAGSYICFYNVEDKETGVTWSQKFYLQVSTMTSEGWMVLCEQDGQSRMDMVINVDEYTDIISRDIWSESDLETGKPIKVMFNYSNAAIKSMNVFVCENGTYMLDKDDMHAGEDNNIRWFFGSQPERVHVRASSVALYDWLSGYDDFDLYWILVDEKGDVYANNASMNGGLFDTPVNQINGVEFKAAPFVANAARYQRKNWNLAGTSTLLYDKAGCFLEVKANGRTPSVIKFTGATLFPAEQPGKEMVMMQATVNDGLTYAVLKDPSGDYYYYGIILGSVGVNTQKYYGKLSGQDLENATHFACHPVLGILYYATKDKIYKFDMKNPGTPAEEICHYPGETITVLKFNPFTAFRQYTPWQDLRSEHLVVGTTVDGVDEKECGIMRTYEFEPQWDRDPILKKEHKKLGKIVDIDYKEIRP